MAGIGAALVGAGDSIIGGLLGGRQKHVSAADNIIRLSCGVMTASEESGIHPLVLLQAGADMGV